MYLRISVDGGWTKWSIWTTCNQCGSGGTKFRTRSCTNPPPANGGKVCSGNDTMTIACNDPCPIDGQWSSWTVAKRCSTTCAGGMKTKTRSCNNPEPAFGGNPCSGSRIEVVPCGIDLCPGEV